MIARVALRLSFAAGAAVALAGCNAAAPPPQASAPPPVAATARAADFQLPPGAPCSREIERWRALQEDDHRAGQVDDSVYEQISREIASAAVACQAGRDAEARSMVTASRRRHGYPL